MRRGVATFGKRAREADELLAMRGRMRSYGGLEISWSGHLGKPKTLLLSRQCCITFAVNEPCSFEKAMHVFARGSLVPITMSQYGKWKLPCSALCCDR